MLLSREVNWKKEIIDGKSKETRASTLCSQNKNKEIEKEK